MVEQSLSAEDCTNLALCVYEYTCLKLEMLKQIDTVNGKISMENLASILALFRLFFKISAVLPNAEALLDDLSKRIDEVQTIIDILEIQQ